MKEFKIENWAVFYVDGNRYYLDKNLWEIQKDGQVCPVPLEEEIAKKIVKGWLKEYSNVPSCLLDKYGIKPEKIQDEYEMSPSWLKRYGLSNKTNKW